MQTVQDFAKAKKVSKAIVDTWIYRHSLPIIQIGRRVYIELSDYELWIAAHKKIVNQQISAHKIETIIPEKCHQSSITSKMRRIY